MNQQCLKRARTPAACPIGRTRGVLGASTILAILTTLVYAQEIPLEIDGSQDPEALEQMAQEFSIVVLDAQGFEVLNLKVESMNLDETRTPPRKRVGSIDLIAAGELQWQTLESKQTALPYRGNAFGLYRLVEDLDRYRNGGPQVIKLRLLDQTSIIVSTKDELLRQIDRLDATSDLEVFRYQVKSFNRFLRTGLVNPAAVSLQSIVAHATKEIWDKFNEKIISSGDLRALFLRDEDWQSAYKEVERLHFGGIDRWNPQDAPGKKRKLAVLGQLVALVLETARLCASPHSRSWPDEALDRTIQQSNGARKGFLRMFERFLNDRSKHWAAEMEEPTEGSAALTSSQLAAVNSLVRTLKSGNSRSFILNVLEQMTVSIKAL